MQTSNIELRAKKRQIFAISGLTSPYGRSAQKPSILDKDLVPSRLKALWAEAEAGRLTTEEFCAHERELIRGYAEIWTDALLLPGEHDLQRSIRVELGNLVGSDDLSEIERKCRSALHDMRDQWNAEVKKGTRSEPLIITAKARIMPTSSCGGIRWCRIKQH